jgi:chemotaxis signal transduction protein
MRLLTFKIGPSRLALKVDSVISVGLDKTGDRSPKTGALTVDLAGALGLSSGSSPHQAIIKCQHQGRLIEIMVDEVLGLENIDQSMHLSWPGALSFLKNFSGAALAGGQTFLTINLDTLLAGMRK